MSESERKPYVSLKMISDAESVEQSDIKMLLTFSERKSFHLFHSDSRYAMLSVIFDDISDFQLSSFQLKLA